MRADPEEHLVDPPQKPRVSLPATLLVLVLGAIAALAYWYLNADQRSLATGVVVETQRSAQQALPDTAPPVPDIPRREAVTTAGSPSPTLTQSIVGRGTQQSLTQSNADAAALSLNAGEARLRDFVDGPGAALGLQKLADSANPIATSAALIDGASRGLLLRKILPLTPPSQAFRVSGEGSLLYMAPDSYARYDDFAAALAEVDADNVVNNFHTLRQLYEASYDELGLDAADFDNAVIRALDMVLATPEITEPIAVQRRSVVYVYADPALESLPPLQKQLLRMGPDNIRLIKQTVRAVRNKLLESRGY